MNRDVTPNFRQTGDCQCELDGCALHGTLGREDRNGRRHVRGCACRVCLGRRNKRKGSSKQAKAVTALGIPRTSLHPGHEEFLGGTIRVEVKAGAQTKPAWTRYRLCEAQSEAQRPIGDHRPFAAVLMPDGESDGLVLVRLSALHEFTSALVEQWGAA